ncbi:MAG TPA: pyrimidine 5'-nucleotidase [Deltaproteobacteria bacterium]|nr:pyrimidine 5'-nucleotidase [Deltaproteobacteria bacterium]
MEMNMVLLDVDDTLYPKGSGPFTQVNSRIDRYVMSTCRIDRHRAGLLRKTYIREYGSTLQGLMRHYGIDPAHYLKDVHDVPVEAMLGRDERLRSTLADLGRELVAFTNGSFEYACRILKALGIDGLITDLFTIEYMDFVPKPLPWAYHKVMQQYGKRPGEYLVVDDSVANVRTAQELGMAAVIVGAEDPEGLALSIPSIYDIPRIVSW